MSEEEKIGRYFVEEEDRELEFFSSGCDLLDLVLGGRGYPLGRISNIVGDRSTGKTLLAIEAFANFNQKYPKGRMYYHEAESAFDTKYAAALGLPTERVNFIEDTNTVEGFYENIDAITKTQDKESPVLYVLDSLDALSDKSELARDFSEDVYVGIKKPKKLSEMFRRLSTEISKTNIHLMIISQIRDRIGVSFGRQYDWAGGKALRFYASQIIFLADLGKITKTIRKITLATGVKIKVKNTKCKVGMPYREAEFPIIFGYGIDNAAANLDWLKGVGAIEELSFPAKNQKVAAKNIRDTGDVDKEKEISDLTLKIWGEIEDEAKPKRSKY